MKHIVKVAELASILYALLFFCGLISTISYYSPFGIDIVSYMSISEILLLFLSNSSTFILLFILIFLLFSIPTYLSYSTNYHYTASQKQTLLSKIFTCIRVVVIVCFSLINYLYHIDTIDASYLIPFGLIFALDFTILPSIIKRTAWGYIRAGINAFKRTTTSTYKNSDGLKKVIYFFALILKPIALFFDSNYDTRKKHFNIITWIYDNKQLCCIMQLYVYVILFSSLINTTMANNYISNIRHNPNSIIVQLNNVQTIDTCNNKEYTYIGSCLNYIFIFNYINHSTLVIPRMNIVTCEVYHHKTNEVVYQFNEKLHLSRES